MSTVEGGGRIEQEEEGGGRGRGDEVVQKWEQQTGASRKAI